MGTPSFLFFVFFLNSFLVKIFIFQMDSELKRVGIGTVLHRKCNAKCQLHMENPIFVNSSFGVHLLPYLTVFFGKPSLLPSLIIICLVCYLKSISPTCHFEFLLPLRPLDFLFWGMSMCF